MRRRPGNGAASGADQAPGEPDESAKKKKKSTRTDGAPDGYHLEMPPLQLAREQRVRRVDVGSVHVEVGASPARHRVELVGRAGHRGTVAVLGRVDDRGREAAAGVTAERVEPEPQRTGVVTPAVAVVQRVPRAQHASLAPGTLLGAEHGHLGMFRGGRGRVPLAPPRGCTAEARSGCRVPGENYRYNAIIFGRCV